MKHCMPAVWVVSLFIPFGLLGCVPQSQTSASSATGEPATAATSSGDEKKITEALRAVKPVEPEPSRVIEPEKVAVRHYEKVAVRHYEEEEEKKETPPEEPPPLPKGVKPLKGSKVLFFEKTADDKRRVYILAEVCLREGQLEVFLCKQNTKEHESILHVDCDARDIHFALIAAKAKEGSTVKYVPKYVPASGTPIKITLTYNLNGKLRTEPAQYWIKDLKTKKEMKHDWVFAGSRFFKFPDEPDRQPFYCANNGEVISIANFPDSMLDLPVKSPRDQADLAFEAWTDRIPPVKTKVLVTLEPKLDEKEKDQPKDKDKPKEKK